MLSISFDQSVSMAKRFVEKHEMPWPQIWGEGSYTGKLANLYGVGALPATFLIGLDGKIVDRDLQGDELFRAIGRELRKMKAAKSKGESTEAHGPARSGTD